MQLIFFVSPNEELEIAPPNMKVKGYMYPQMKKTCGHAVIVFTKLYSFHFDCDVLQVKSLISISYKKLAFNLII